MNTDKPGDQSQELLDVVDDNDRVIDTRTRGEIHRLDLKHRAVHLLVFNDAGQLFLQKRSLLKDNNPGLWDSSVSGHVDASESYDECVVREAREEIGLKLLETPERLFKIDACPETDFEFSWAYRCIAEGPFVLDPVEIDLGVWLEPVEFDHKLAANHEDFAQTIRLIWAMYRQI